MPKSRRIITVNWDFAHFVETKIKLGYGLRRWWSLTFDPALPLRGTLNSGSKSAVLEHRLAAVTAIAQ